MHERCAVFSQTTHPWEKMRNQAVRGLRQDLRGFMPSAADGPERRAFWAMGTRAAGDSIQGLDY